jgi:cytochrome c-type biogenesis protein CcmF
MPWTLFSAMVLGTGIMLGGYWAYGVLGWGGYGMGPL